MDKNKISKLLYENFILVECSNCRFWARAHEYSKVEFKKEYGFYPCDDCSNYNNSKDKFPSWEISKKEADKIADMIIENEVSKNDKND